MICRLVIMMKGLYWFALQYIYAAVPAFALYAGKERTKRND